MKPLELIDSAHAERIRQKLTMSASRFARDALEFRSIDRVFYLLAAAALENAMKAILFKENWLLVIGNGKVKEGVVALQSKPADVRSIGAREALELLVMFSKDFDTKIKEEILAILKRRNGFAHFAVLDVTAAELLEDTRTFVRAISFLSSRTSEALWGNMKSVAASLTKDRLADRTKRLKGKVDAARKQTDSAAVPGKLLYNQAPFTCPLCKQPGVLTGKLDLVDDENFPFEETVELNDGEIDKYEAFLQKVVLRVHSFCCPSCLLHLEDVEEIELASSEGLVAGLPHEADALEATEEDYFRELEKDIHANEELI
jgi:hypothetical protein